MPVQEEPELVSRPVQAGLGLFTGVMAYCTASGGLFPLVFAAANGRALRLRKPLARWVNQEFVESLVGCARTLSAEWRMLRLRFGGKPMEPFLLAMVSNDAAAGWNPWPYLALWSVAIVAGCALGWQLGRRERAHE